MAKKISAVRVVKYGGKKKVMMYSGPKTKKTYKKQFNTFEEEVARLVNKERTDRGLQPLTLNSSLANVARIKSADMRDNNYFGHISPTYGDPGQMLQRFGINWRSYGENIAAGQSTPAAVMNSWMNSPGHRSNILNPNFTDIGVGYVPGTSSSTYSSYWTQLFIQRP